MEPFMSVTAAEVMQLLKGEGSAELQAQFLHEMDDSESPLRKMLAATETWARQKLNVNSPSPSAAGDSNPGTTKYRVVRKAALWGDEMPATVQIRHLLDYFQGIASPETIALVDAAMKDPSSDLFKFLLLMKQQEE
jgi:hypothetical protein